jgi:hypothetical protein
MMAYCVFSRGRILGWARNHIELESLLHLQVVVLGTGSFVTTATTSDTAATRGQYKTAGTSMRVAMVLGPHMSESVKRWFNPVAGGRDEVPAASNEQGIAHQPRHTTFMRPQT